MRVAIDRVALDQRLILEAIRRISDAQLIQLVDEAARKGGLKATPRDDDTFLNDEKGCLFLLTATGSLVCFNFMLCDPRHNPLFYCRFDLFRVQIRYI